MRSPSHWMKENNFLRDVWWCLLQRFQIRCRISMADSMAALLQHLSIYELRTILKNEPNNSNSRGWKWNIISKILVLWQQGDERSDSGNNHLKAANTCPPNMVITPWHYGKCFAYNTWLNICLVIGSWQKMNQIQHQIDNVGLVTDFISWRHHLLLSCWYFDR